MLSPLSLPLHLSHRPNLNALVPGRPGTVSSYPPVIGVLRLFPIRYSLQPQIPHRCNMFNSEVIDHLVTGMHPL
jgi:hypothetical protein